MAPQCSIPFCVNAAQSPQNSISLIRTPQNSISLIRTHTLNKSTMSNLNKDFEFKSSYSLQNNFNSILHLSHTNSAIRQTCNFVDFLKLLSYLSNSKEVLLLYFKKALTSIHPMIILQSKLK